MRELGKKALINGQTFGFEAMVEHASEWRQVFAALLDLGCKVRIADSVEPLDVVVIDGSFVWCGDAVPLPYPRGDACALRLVSRGVAAEGQDVEALVVGINHPLVHALPEYLRKRTGPMCLIVRLQSFTYCSFQLTCCFPARIALRLVRF